MNRLQRENIIEVVSQLLGEQRRCNIAIFVSKFSKFEGAGFVAWQQAKDLLANGYNVTIFTFESDFDSFHDIKIVQLQPNPIKKNSIVSNFYRAFFSFNVFAILRLIFLLRDFDLVIVHQGNLAPLAYLCKRFWKTKVIFWNHHVGEPIFRLTPLDIARLFYTRIFSLIYWRLIKSFDLIVSVSHFSRKMLKEKTGLDSIVIYNKINLQKFKKGLDGTIIRKKHQIEKEPVILYVGRIAPHKGIHYLIEAFKLAKSFYPSAKLIIVGKSYHDKYFHKLKKIANASVIFAGAVDEKELPLYYAACDVYATCSLFEGFNLTLVEAQACGKPVVAFDIAPHREIVKNGFLVEKGNINEFAKMLIHLMSQQSDKEGALRKVI